MGVTDILKISFEFSQKLGVRELPELNKNHESNVNGLYIVGDLADAPIIKIALNQGYDVARHVWDNDHKGTSSKDDDILDVIVIGAGPAGIGAALALKEKGARYVLLEKERPFNTIQNFPKSKFVFSEPRSIENRGSFWFMDSQKENLVQRWEEEIENKGLLIQQPEEVTGVERKGDYFEVSSKVGEGGLMWEGKTAAIPAIDPTQDPASYMAGIQAGEGSKNVYKARRVILAIGRRGTVTKMNVPGEELEKVSYALKDPDEHKDRRVMIFGGGDSAVEAAASCAEAGAEVTISYRKDTFHRAKAGNQEKIDALIKAGKIRAEMSSSPKEIREESVVIKRGEEEIEIPNDDVFVFFGTKLPKPFLEKTGIRFAGQMDFWRAVWISSFALMTYCFYVIKSKKDFIPFGGNPFEAGGLLDFIPGALKLSIGFRDVDGSFWGTCVYATIITVFGLMAYKKYPSKLQKKRYLSLISFQLLFLFGLPEIIIPLLYKFSSMDLFARGYKLYALSVPWPLSIWSVVDAPGWGPGVTSNVALGWVGLGLFASFVLLPVFIRYNGERFCSYMCGCGGLAETLGDRWRHLAPRGKDAQRLEVVGVIFMILAIPTTLLILNDAWQFFQPETFASAKNFAQTWYGLIVDFWFASVIGVAFYPYLGNRVWCRFFCPLRAMMEKMSHLFGKITIKPNDKCIGCGECTRYCQMGIPVQKYAQKKMAFHNGNSACIQCGICIQVCPMEVLSIGERDFTLKAPRLA